MRSAADGYPQSDGAMQDAPFVLSVVGLQDAGKTTLVTQMIAHWVNRGFRVGSIKHDGHADFNLHDDWEKAGSDTAMHAEAGSSYTMVTGGGRTLLRTVHDAEAGNPEALAARIANLAVAQGEPLDIIVVEGFKYSEIAKVVRLRRMSDVMWMQNEQLANVRAVVYSDACLPLADIPGPVYHETDVARLCDDLMERYRKSCRGEPGGSSSEVK